jgi:uncharacterized protein YlxW (UPF0749 family)
MKLRSIGLFVMCVVIGLLIVVQSRTTNGMQLYVSSKAITDYKTTIASEVADKARIKTLITEAQKKLQEYQLLANNEDPLLKNKIKEELDYYKMISGKTAVHGEGVIVIVDDGTRALVAGENPNSVLVHDMDILTVINELNRSGAEVLAVNGQRITNNTSISCSGYTIRINDQFFARPFEIRAIGDSKRMAAALLGPDGYGTLLRDYGVIFKITIKDDLTIPQYTDDETFDYMSKVKEEE